MLDRSVTTGTPRENEPATTSVTTANTTSTTTTRSSRDSLVPRTSTAGAELAVDGVVSSSPIFPTTTTNTKSTPTSTAGNITPRHDHSHSHAHNNKNNNNAIMNANDKRVMAETTTNRSRRSTSHHQSTLSTTSSMSTSNTAPTSSSSFGSTDSTETGDSPRDPVDEFLESWERCVMDQQEHHDLQESPSKVGFTAGTNTTTGTTGSTTANSTTSSCSSTAASSTTTSGTRPPHHEESTNNPDQQDDLHGIVMPLHSEEMTGMALFCKPRQNVKSSCPLGITVIQIGWRRVIAHWDPQGLLAQSAIHVPDNTTPCSELQVGQTILAVNGIAADDFASCQDLLETLEREQKIVIVATQSVLVILRQGRQTSRGLVLGVQSDNGDKNRVIVLHRINHATDFDDDNNDGPDLTLLQPRMKILAINDSTLDLDLYEANRILQGYSMGTLPFLRILAVCENRSVTTY